MSGVPPCLDVYVWVEARRLRDVVAEFIRRYVDVDDPGDVRVEAFSRVWIHGGATAADHEALADLRRDPDGGKAFSLYLRARHHHAAIITITEEGALILGLSIDDPHDSPETVDQAAELLTRLRDEFAASAGAANVELPPPQCTAEWVQAEAILRVEGAGPARRVM